MYSWIHRDLPLYTLVQFVGDHTVSIDFPHGNAKKRNQPYHRSAPSLLRDLEVGDHQPAQEYHQRVTQAEPSLQHQTLRVPRNTDQIRSARKLFKKMTEGVDIFTKLNKLALNYEDIRLLMTIPDLLVVSIQPDMLSQIKEIFKIDYDTARLKQLVG